MRLLHLTFADIRFQWKYGFYLLYAIFAAVYVMVLFAVPDSARQTVATVMIYTDPAAMGLFFMGAIILLEKSQHVNTALSTTPVRYFEYMFAKLLSLAVIGIIVGLLLAFVGGITHILPCVTGILLTSVLCSACGLIAAERSKTLNQFILFAVPFELFLCLPPVLLLFGIETPYLIAFPGVAAVLLIYGEASHFLMCFLSLVIWCVPALYLCNKSIRRYFTKAGGATL